MMLKLIVNVMLATPDLMEVFVKHVMQGILKLILVLTIAINVHNIQRLQLDLIFLVIVFVILDILDNQELFVQHVRLGLTQHLLV